MMHVPAHKNVNHPPGQLSAVEYERYLIEKRRRAANRERVIVHGYPEWLKLREAA